MLHDSVLTIVAAVTSTIAFVDMIPSINKSISEARSVKLRL